MTEQPAWAERPWENPAAIEAKEAESQRFNRRFKWGCVLWIAAIPLLFIIGSIWNAVVGNSKGDSSAALEACKRAASAQLANPATADFEILAITLTETDSGFDISGPLNAKTGFGVEQSLTFSCTTTKAGVVISVHVS